MFDLNFKQFLILAAGTVVAGLLNAYDMPFLCYLSGVVTGFIMRGKATKNYIGF
jgi:hypothetical protein